jgi:hypothetical protein
MEGVDPDRIDYNTSIFISILRSPKEILSQEYGTPGQESNAKSPEYDHSSLRAGYYTARDNLEK